jgi:hypothetical protein
VHSALLSVASGNFLPRHHCRTAVNDRLRSLTEKKKCAVVSCRVNMNVVGFPYDKHGDRDSSDWLQAVRSGFEPWWLQAFRTNPD